MEYHLDRKIVLNNDTGYKSLYTWCLNEIDETGNKNGRDLIPWGWDLYFYLADLKLIHEVTIERAPFDKADEGEPSLAERRVIRAKLLPNEKGSGRWTNYSMFGTDRRITDFSLAISVASEGQPQPRCLAFGSVAYTTEIDFRDEEVGDWLSFQLFVSQELFDRYAQQIAISPPEFASFRVGGVRGFYSEWSPGISTSSIKVLAAGREHQVQIPEGCEIDPPRLGEVAEANLSLSLTKLMEPPVTEDGGEAEPDDRHRAASTAAPREAAPRADARLPKLLSSIRTAAWVIAGLLLLLLIKACDTAPS